MTIDDIQWIYNNTIYPLRTAKDSDQKYVLFLRDDESIIGVSLAKHTFVTTTGLIYSKKRGGGECIFSSSIVSQVVIMSSDEFEPNLSNLLVRQV